MLNYIDVNENKKSSVLFKKEWTSYLKLSKIHKKKLKKEGLR